MWRVLLARRITAEWVSHVLPKDFLQKTSHWTKDSRNLSNRKERLRESLHWTSVENLPPIRHSWLPSFFLGKRQLSRKKPSKNRRRLEFHKKARGLSNPYKRFVPRGCRLRTSADGSWNQPPCPWAWGCPRATCIFCPFPKHRNEYDEEHITYKENLFITSSSLYQDKDSEVRTNQ